MQNINKLGHYNISETLDIAYLSHNNQTRFQAYLNNDCFRKSCLLFHAEQYLYWHS